MSCTPVYCRPVARLSFPIGLRPAGSTRSLGQVAKRGFPLLADPSPGNRRETETQPTLVASAISSFIPGPMVELIETFLM
jgi:hypothetical protein